MIKSFDGKSPRIAPSALIHDTAYIIGDVKIGENSSVWPGAVIRGDLASIVIGIDASIQDNSVIHCDEDLVIGDNVIIGHTAVVHCRKIGDSVIIGNNATLLDGVEIGNHCIISAGATLIPNTRIPDGSLVAGTPAKVKSSLSAEHMALLEHAVESYRTLTRKYKQQGF